MPSIIRRNWRFPTCPMDRTTDGHINEDFEQNTIAKTAASLFQTARTSCSHSHPECPVTEQARPWSADHDGHQGR
jgi:hypothetical protein